jgi:cardiolipin synthase
MNPHKSKNHKAKKTLIKFIKTHGPNCLSYIRAMLGICVFFYIFQKKYIAAIVLFVIAAITDLFDGYLARLWSSTSKFGALLDPIADKILINLSMYSIAYFYCVDINMSYTAAYVIRFIFWIVLCRDILIGIGAAFSLKMNISARPVFFGKVLAALNMVLCCLILLQGYFPYKIHETYLYMIFGTIVLMQVILLVQYFMRFIRECQK